MNVCKIILSILLLLIATMGVSSAQIAKEGLVWVFNGDSITKANRYSNYVESYYHLRYPQYKMHFRSVGRSGAQLDHMLQPASGQGGHYKNRTYAFSPDIISIMFGHNDASYSVAEWGSILNSTLDEIESTSTSSVVLFGPHPQHGGGKPFLEGFSQLFVEVGATRGYMAVDTWAALKPIWDSQSSASLGIPDGTHPGATGHACIAAALLKGLNEDGFVSSADIDAANGVLRSAVNATVTNISTTGQGVAFDRLDDRLPMSLDPESYPAIDFCPDILDMNRYMLTVSGLAPGSYDLYVDGVKSASGISSTALANGWNMARMEAGPIYDQLNDVLNAIRDKQGIGRSSLSRVGPPWKGIERYISAVGKDEGSYESMVTSTVDVRASIDDADVVINALAQPVQRRFELRRVGAAPTEYSLTTSAVNGRISPASGVYGAGETVSLTAIPDAGYSFTRWEGDATGTSTYTQITFNGNRSVTAIFTPEPQQYTLTIDAINGSVSPSGGVFVDGTRVDLVATPDEGYQFDGWSGNVSSDTVVMNSDQLVSATFSPIPVSYSLSTSVTGGGRISPEGGTFSDGEVVSLEAVADAGWRFDGWSDNVSLSAITMNADQEVVATFTEIPRYSLVTSAANGTVSPANGTFEEGAVVTLTAVSDEGYQFDGWGGDLVGTASSVELLMNSDMNVIALFSPEAGEVGVVAEYVPPAGLPSPSFGVHEYAGVYTHYVDSEHANATDTDNANGSPERPRKTIPLTVPAGSIIEVRNYQPIDGLSRVVYRLNGSRDNPVFIRGALIEERAVIAGQAGSPNQTEIVFEGQYFIVENLDFHNNVRVEFSADSAFGVLRNSVIRNPDGLAGESVSALVVGGENTVIYNNEIYDNVSTGGAGVNGIEVAGNTDSVWILNNRVYGNSGSALLTCQQCALDQPRNIYVGENEFSGDARNLIDISHASNVVISSNKFSSSSGEVSSIVVGSSGIPENVWILFNEIKDLYTGVQVENVGKLWLIGNLFHSLEGSAVGLGDRGDVGLINNTIYRADSFITQLQGGSFTLDVVGNIVVDLLARNVAGHLYLDSRQVYFSSEFRSNLFWQSGGDLLFVLGAGNRATFSSTAELGQYPFGEDNIISNPQLIDPEQGNFQLKFHSPAIDSGVDHIAYQEFETAFGISIKKDEQNISRPQKSGWDMGALEYGGAVLATPDDLRAAVVTDGYIDLAWVDNSNDEDGFIIEYSEDGGTTYAGLTTTNANATNYRTSGVDTSKSYHYRVSSYNRLGMSDYSDPARTQSASSTGSTSSVSERGEGGATGNSLGGGVGPLNLISLLLLLVYGYGRKLRSRSN